MVSIRSVARSWTVATRPPPGSAEATLVAQRDAGKAACQVAHDGIEENLIAALRALRCRRQRRRPAIGRPVDAGDLVTLKAGDVDDVERKIGRRAGVADLIGDAPTAAELHRPRIHGIGAGVKDVAVTLLDQQALDPAPTQIGGERKADRTAADDENGHFGCAALRCFRQESISLSMPKFCHLFAVVATGGGFPLAWISAVVNGGAKLVQRAA